MQPVIKFISDGTLFQFPEEKEIKSSLYNDKWLRPEDFCFIPRLLGMRQVRPHIFESQVPNLSSVTQKEKEEALAPIVNLAARRFARRQFAETGISKIAFEVLEDVNRGIDRDTGNPIPSIRINAYDDYNIYKVEIALTQALKRCSVTLSGRVP